MPQSTLISKGFISLAVSAVILVAVAKGVEPVTPNASPEVRVVFSYLESLRGKQTLSGQMWAPWGPDEIRTVESLTGRKPAIRGHDLLHERSNARELMLVQQWWERGGIPTLMWHWGAPTKGEGYEQSKMTIDIDRCFEEGTAEHTAMWADLKRIADHLTVLRDAGVPVLWRPMHEFDGEWFWYGKGGGERFVKLWRTMFDYFARERELKNLIWVLCHSGRVNQEWNPGKAYYDFAGGDSYDRGPQAQMYRAVAAVHSDALPIPYHECGTLPSPERCLEEGAMWSWWMLWHTRHLTRHDPQELRRIYNHDLVVTRDELPDLREAATLNGVDDDD